MHIVLMNLNDPDDLDEVVRRFVGLKDKIPELIDFKVGRNVIESERAWDLGLVALVDSIEDLQAYQVNPDHREAAEYSAARRSAVASVDFYV